MRFFEIILSLKDVCSIQRSIWEIQCQPNLFAGGMKTTSRMTPPYFSHFMWTCFFFTFPTRSFLVSHFQSAMNRCKARSINHIDYHCVKTILVWSFSGPHFPIFRLNTQRYPVSLGIQSECGKMQTRKTSNTDTLHAVNFL